jgi:hypothetical protein
LKIKHATKIRKNLNLLMAWVSKSTVQLNYILKWEAQAHSISKPHSWLDLVGQGFMLCIFGSDASLKTLAQRCALQPNIFGFVDETLNIGGIKAFRLRSRP